MSYILQNILYEITKKNIGDNGEILNSVLDNSEWGLFSEFPAYVSTHLPTSNLKL